MFPILYPDFRGFGNTLSERFHILKPYVPNVPKDIKNTIHTRARREPRARAYIMRRRNPWEHGNSARKRLKCKGKSVPNDWEHAREHGNNPRARMQPTDWPVSYLKSMGSGSGSGNEARSCSSPRPPAPGSGELRSIGAPACRRRECDRFAARLDRPRAARARARPCGRSSSAREEP